VAAPVNIPSEMKSITSQLPQLRFPIADSKTLLSQVSGKPKYTVFGRTVTPAKGVSHVPASWFPIKDQADFESKATAKLAKQAVKRGLTITGYTLPTKPVKPISPTKPA
jgi:hypothetical protein